MPKGIIRRVPYEFDSFINNLKTSENLPNLKITFLRMKDYAILGKETNRLSKNFGVKIIK